MGVVGKTGAVFLLRVMLPDRPGTLGAVASALGEAQADIDAVEIVEKAHGYAIDDFMLTVPDDAQPDALISACAGLADVEVLWVSQYPQHWRLLSDTTVWEEMVSEPDKAETILLAAAPAVFHCTWAMLIDPEGRLLASTELAPTELTPTELGAPFGDLSAPHVGDLPPGWLNGWGEHAYAVAPFTSSRNALVIARPGPEFRRAELVRLRHLTLMPDLRVPVA